MKKQEIVRALRLFAEGFNALANAYEPTQEVEEKQPTEMIGASVPTTPSRPVEAKKEQPVSEIKKEAVAPKKEAKKEESTNTISKEDLEALSYNEVKAKAKEIGVKAVGSKASIISNILATFEDTDPTEAPKVEEIKEENTSEEESINIEDLNEDEGEEENEEEDTSFYDKVVADLEEYSDEELADILSEIGISPKGKRQALLAKIVQAIEDGKLEWSDDEEETAEDTQADTQEEDGIDEEYDFVTEARKQTCLALDKRIRKDFNEGKLSSKEILKYLKNYDEEYVSEGKENDLDNYILIKMNLVDEEGNENELGEAYYIGEKVYCCGAELKELDEGFLCEICGQQYEV